MVTKIKDLLNLAAYVAQGSAGAYSCLSHTGDTAVRTPLHWHGFSVHPSTNIQIEPEEAWSSFYNLFCKLMVLTLGLWFLVLQVQTYGIRFRSPEEHTSHVYFRAWLST